MKTKTKNRPISKKKINNRLSFKRSHKTNKSLQKFTNKNKSGLSDKKIDILEEVNNKDIFFKEDYEKIQNKGYGNFANTLFHGRMEKFIAQFNHNEIIFEKKIIAAYIKFKSTLFYEYRVAAIPSPFPMFMTNDFINEYYKNQKSYDLCLIANTYVYLVPFLLFDFDEKIQHKLKNMKIMLFKDVSETDNKSEYAKKEAIFNTIREQKRIIIEGNFDYDINNYLLDYIKNPNVITRKYKTIILLKGTYMDLLFPTKLYNYILTSFFNLEVNGNFIIHTALTFSFGDHPDFFSFWVSLFNSYKIIKQQNNDYFHEYPYLYEFYNFKGISTNSLIELSKLIINSNKTTIINFSDFTTIKPKDIKNGIVLVSKLFFEKSKYAFFMIHLINYYKNYPVHFIHFYANMIMYRIFIMYNNVNKFKVTYDLKELNKCINEYYENICCFDEYYRNIEMSINRYREFITIDKEIRLSDKLLLPSLRLKYSYDFVYRFIFNIDIIKHLLLNCSNKQLNYTQSSLVDNNINKIRLVDVIINNFKTFTIPIKKYLLNPPLFVEHYEILNKYISILKKINTYSSSAFNYFHFGHNKSDLQFISSFNYFIKSNYKKEYDSFINLYTNITQKSLNSEDYNLNYIKNYDISIISEKLADSPINFISSDDIQDIEIDGYNIKNIDLNFSNDSVVSDFNIVDKLTKDIIDSSIRDLEYHEFYKLCMVFSILSVGGDCCIKHLALPLNSYLIYRGYYNTIGFFINYLYIYSQLFENITLYKPSTSPNESLEFYVIGTRFLGIDYNLKEKLLNILNNFELHQTLFKKEDINKLFLKDVELFLELMTNRFVDYEKIKTLLKGGLLYNDTYNNYTFKKNEIIINLLNNSKLEKKLNTNIYDDWKKKHLLTDINNINNFKKVYYFTPIENIDNNKIIVDFTILEKLLDNNNFLKMKSKYDAKDLENTLSFIHTYLPRKNFTIPQNTYLINIINDSFLTSKNILYHTCLNYNKSLTTKYINESYIIDFDKNISNYNHLFKNNQFWNVKTVNNFNNKTNFIISSIDELHKLFDKKLNKKSKKSLKKNIMSSSDSSQNLILDKNITNPLLYKKKKFHIRMFYIVFINSKKEILSFITKYGLLITAKDDYNNDSKYYQDLKIHVPSVLFTDNDYLFPNDFAKEFGEQKTKIVLDKIIELFQFISKVQINNISNFPNTKNGYCILTSDLIIDTDFNVKMIELNNNTGLYTKKIDTNNILSKYLYDNIYNEIIASVFNIGKIKVNEKIIRIFPLT
jgi:hypothetical protein